MTLSNTNDRITFVADNCIELFDNNKNLFDCNLAEKLKTIFKEKGYEFYIDSPTNQQFFIVDNKKLEELELHCSRRVIVKYRQQLNIPSSTKRKVLK